MSRRPSLGRFFWGGDPVVYDGDNDRTADVSNSATGMANDMQLPNLTPCLFTDSKPLDGVCCTGASEMFAPPVPKTPMLVIRETDTGSAAVPRPPAIEHP